MSTVTDIIDDLKRIDAIEAANAHTIAPTLSSSRTVV